MPKKMGCREIHFINATRPSQVDILIDRLKETVLNMKLPPEYDVRIYRNVFACCGIGGLEVIVEVVGPDEEKIKAIDVKTVSKIMEFCEQEGIELGHHEVEKHEIL